MLMRSITTWIFDPAEPLLLASRFSDLEGTFLFFSGGKLDCAQHSYLCLFPEKKITLSAQQGCWEQLEKALGPFNSDLPLPKWVGYLGYEMGCYADQDIVAPCFPSETPDACFYRPSTVIHFNHATSMATLYSAKQVSLERTRIPSTGELKLASHSDSFESYAAKIAQAKKWILDGEVYQVNLSQEFYLEGKSDPFELFQKASALNPAPFSAFAHCGTFALVSSSPERFLARKGDLLETRPIKGTAPRGKSPEEDAFNRKVLMSSEKERAELLMITDLMRNDLGKVSLPGSVKTREMWRCETYANVFHLLSIIEGRSKENSVSLIRQLFPGGSITGCPKLRAMEAIALLEKRARGVYTGSIGYFSANGDFDFNIAIRTLEIHPAYSRIQLGGAIVIDSDPVKEFEETLHKGASLFQILGAHELCVL